MKQIWMVIRYEWRVTLKQWLIWAGVMLFLAVLGCAKYSVVAEAEAGTMLATIPPLMQRVFGIYEDVAIDSAAGYVICLWLWYAFVACTAAGVFGAGLVGRDDRLGAADFLFTKPLGRTELLIGKGFAAAAQMAVLTGIAWLVTAVMILPHSNERIGLFLAAAMIGLYLTQLLYLMFGAVLALVPGLRRHAQSLSIGLVILGYAISVALEWLNNIAFLPFTPFWYWSAISLWREGWPLPITGLAAVIWCLGAMFLVWRFRRHSWRS